MALLNRPALGRMSRRWVLAGLGTGVGLGVVSACGAASTASSVALGARSASTPSGAERSPSSSPLLPPSRPTSAPTFPPAPAAAPASTPVPTFPLPTATAPAPASATAAPTATPISVNGNPERLRPNGPPRDPGPLDWAHPGPYRGAGFSAAEVASFRVNQSLMTTYYFYWFDLTDPARREPDWKLHPPDPDHYTFLSAAWHRRQFEDMQAAGIDFALPVYWGEPGHPGRAFNLTPNHFWSTEGIPPMVAALDALAAAGRPFKVGMFYDTTILANADLTTPNGQAYFGVNVRDFFSRVPPRHWAAIGGKPVVWLYDTAWVSRFDQSTFDDLSARFAADFGGLHPYVVRESQWYRAKGVQPSAVLHTDNLYGWGAAAFGYNPDQRFGVAEVGPGFDNTGDCSGGSAAGCFKADRANGAYFTGQLDAALRSGRKLVAIETWNEFDESSGIAETIELGRRYLQLARQFADAFHRQS